VVSVVYVDRTDDSFNLMPVAEHGRVIGDLPVWESYLELRWAPCISILNIRSLVLLDQGEVGGGSTGEKMVSGRRWAEWN
jgi:hypothetical protein